MFDVIIRGATIVSSTAREPADLAIIGEKVCAVLPPGTTAAARTQVDATDQYILPGLIDTHVHLRDPARPDRETFESGTAAAAAGGITTIFEMPTSEPPVNTGERLTKRAEIVATRAIVDFALYGGAGPENLHEIPKMAKAGAIAFKTWLHAPVAERKNEFFGLCCPNKADLPAVMLAVANTGLRHAMHCEDEETLRSAAQKIGDSISPAGIVHALSRPIAAEDIAVKRVLEIAHRLNARVQIVHLSSPSAARMVENARKQGVDATIEVCPHYLILNEQTLREYGPFAKCNPPLRSESTVEELWLCIQDGLVDVIGSDHCAFLPEELAAGSSDISASPPGLPGLETMLPILLTATHDGMLRLEDVVRLTSQRAAELFGLKTKGSLLPGFDADFVIIDPTENWRYQSEHTFSKAGANARYFEGRQFTGRIKQTWVRGRQVFDGSKITGVPGFGRHITP